MRTVFLSSIILFFFSFSLVGQPFFDVFPKSDLEDLKAKIETLKTEGKFKEALVFSEQMTQITEAEFGQNSEVYLEALNLSAALYFNLGNLPKANEVYQKTVKMSRETFGKNSIVYIRSVIGLGECLLTEEKAKPALPLLEETETWIRKNLEENHPYFLKVTGFLSLAYEKTGAYEKSLNYHTDWMNLAEKLHGKESEAYLYANNSLGALYRQTGQFEKCIELLEKALEPTAAVFGKEHEEYSQILNFLGSANRELGHFDRALPYFEEALIIREKLYGKTHPNYAEILNNMALVYQNSGQFEMALPLNKSVAEILEKTVGKNHPYYFYTLNNIGSLYHEMGKLDLALSNVLEALNIFVKIFGKEHPYYNGVLSNLAGIYTLLGQTDKGIKLGLEAKESSEKYLGKDHIGYAQTVNNLADSYMEAGRFDEAVPLLKEALETSKKAVSENNIRYISSLPNLGNAYEKLGERDSALFYYTEGLKRARKLLGDDHSEIPFYQTALANFYLDNGEFEKALTLSEKAFEIREKTHQSNHPDYTSTLFALATACFRTGNDERGEHYYGELLQAYRNQITDFYPYLDEKGRLNFLERPENRIHKITSFVARNPGHVSELQSLQLSLKGLSLQNSIEARTEVLLEKGLGYELRETYAEWQTLRRKIGKVNTMSIPKRAKKNIDLEMLIVKADSLEEKLSREIHTKQIQTNACDSEIVNSEMLQNSLNEAEAAIDIIHFRYHSGKEFTGSTVYFAFINRADKSEPYFVKMSDEKQIESVLAASVSTKNNMNYITNLEKNRALYQLIWQPLEPYLKGIEKINISPSGLLNQVAFDALKTDKNGGELLLEKYEIAYYGNLRDFIFQKEKTQPSESIATVGGAYYDLDSTQLAAIAQQKFNTDETLAFEPAETKFNLRSAVSDSTRNSIRFNYLSGTKKEAENIHRLFNEKGWKSDLITGQNATEDQIKSLSGDRAPDILHIATHGYFFNKNDQNNNRETTLRERIMNAKNPLLRSGLVFSGVNYTWLGGQPIEGLEDGVLTAYEISNLDLFNTKLAVLSACETGRGDVHDAEGVFGLQRAFKTAGVDQLIISLWKVPDMATSEMMTLFYKYYLKGNSAKAAFRKAQLKMAKKYEPYFWAAFVLVE